MRCFIYVLCIFLSCFHISYGIEITSSILDELESYPSYDYPYHDLPNILERKGKDKITIFTYGSLLSRQSAKRTLSEQTLQSRKPVFAYGLKRLFNRDVPVFETSAHRKPNDHCARGMLNVAYTGNPYDFINGVIFEVPLREISAILDREVGYDLIPIYYMDSENEESGPQIAYTFRAKEKSEYTNHQIKPRPRYYELARDGAKEYGPIFYSIWLNTTYYADGKTSITEWEDAWQNGEEYTKAQ